MKAGSMVACPSERALCCTCPRCRMAPTTCQRLCVCVCVCGVCVCVCVCVRGVIMWGGGEHHKPSPRPIHNFISEKLALGQRRRLNDLLLYECVSGQNYYIKLHFLTIDSSWVKPNILRAFLTVVKSSVSLMLLTRVELPWRRASHVTKSLLNEHTQCTNQSILDCIRT